MEAIELQYRYPSVNVNIYICVLQVAYNDIITRLLPNVRIKSL